jgi:hypothetical protein
VQTAPPELRKNPAAYFHGRAADPGVKVPRNNPPENGLEPAREELIEGCNRPCPLVPADAGTQALPKIKVCGFGKGWIPASERV